MLKFYANTQDAMQDKPIVPTGYTEAQWDSLCLHQMLRIQNGNTLRIETGDRELTLSSSFGLSPDDRYNNYINTKQLAMAYGNTYAGVESSSVDYYFEKGYEGAVYKGTGNHPYLQTLQQMGPGEAGELSLLSSRCVGIDITADKVTMVLDGQLCDSCEIYLELNAYAWCLYHYVNLQAHRLFDYDPANRYWGLLMSYQALVAKWNNTVWKSIYRLNTETVRETLTFELGYSCTKCTSGKMTIKAVIELIDGFVPYGYSYPSTNELVIYRMGERQIASDTVKENTVVTIRRLFSASGTGITDSGTGNEALNINGPSWVRYEVTVEIPSMKQRDSYIGVFSLARSMYSRSMRNIPRADLYPDGDLPTHTMNLTVSWAEEGGETLTRKQEGIKVLALDNLPDDWFDSSVASFAAG